MSEHGGIKVPDKYDGEFKEKKPKRDYMSKEYREALVRDYVRANKGKVMKMTDFGMHLYNVDSPGRANPTIQALIKEGKLIRIKRKTKKQGVSYTYIWAHDLSSHKSSPRNGPVTTVRPADPGKLPSFKETLYNLIDDFKLVLRNEQENKEMEIVYGLYRFRDWVEDRGREDEK